MEEGGVLIRTVESYLFTMVTSSFASVLLLLCVYCSVQLKRLSLEFYSNSQIVRNQNFCRFPGPCLKLNLSRDFYLQRK